MTDVIAGQNITSTCREIPEVNNPRPANQKENPPNQPPGEMREKTLCKVLGEHVKGAEVRSCRTSGAMEYWSDGVLERWSIGDAPGKGCC